jgi:Fe-Mn family superoxide dismutase
MVNRRDVMKVMGVSAIASVVRIRASAAAAGRGQMTPQATAPAVSSGPFTLPPLTYAYDALEPYIDAQTMHLHHDKHHAAYVKNLNAAVANYPELGKMPVEELVRHVDKVPEAVRTAVRNNGGGHATHSFFWLEMQKGTTGQPKAELGRAIDKTFGSFSAFQEQFAKAAMSVFGSGWAWVTVDDKHDLAIETTPNQDNPWMAGKTPIVGIDVWEHAYYLKYQNVRADYVAAFQKVISWDYAGERYQKAVGGMMM